jgi:hypothetical protein
VVLATELLFEKIQYLQMNGDNHQLSSIHCDST